MNSSTPRKAIAASAVFADDEPVLQSHPLIKGAEIPRFGDCGDWAMHATPRPANLPPCRWVIQLGHLGPAWNLRAREIAMALLNPEHPGVIHAGVHLGAEPTEVGTVRQIVAKLSQLAEWAAENGLSADLRGWSSDDLRSFIEYRRPQLTPGSLVTDLRAVRLLHQLGPLLTGGGMADDPWEGQSNAAVARHTRGQVKTHNIAPQVWFPLVRAAWTYVHEFSADILAARNRYQWLQHRAGDGGSMIDRRLDAYLADPAKTIPLHTVPAVGRRTHVVAGEINWGLLRLLLGFDRHVTVFRRSASDPRRAKVEAAVAAGRGVPGGLLPPEHAPVLRPDGAGPWHPGLCPRTMAKECVALRGAAYCFIAAMSMMRDSEIREITRGSVADFYGAPAIRSTKRKRDRDRPQEHWWIIEPVAEAITVAEALSWHADLVFAADESNAKAGGFDSRTIVKDFIAHVNAGTDYHGMHIPAGRVTPHMFRKTMAMLTGDEPGAEIALGFQLKHVATRILANRGTQGYSARDAAWDKLLGTAVDTARFERLSEFFDDYKAGKTIGFGPGVDKLTAAFDAIQQTAEEMVATGQARQGDARVERDLLRKFRISIRFGTLNHCTLDENNPVGAKCLEGTVKIPEGHRGPLVDRCQPGRCANSIIGPEHLPIHKAEKSSLLRLRQDTKLPEGRRALIDRQLAEVQAVIDRAEHGQENRQ
ncbi:hypothetical protein GCM10010402_08130 [Actinomadura luteofluorescens]|uniref:site-specific integrase n=1 Tax=Actinomadura luteofluorescens TaxID=46163 RepID=UPI002164325E|nr:site-specific integrase [Actinomadura glauciflava]MCR3738368.1 hypothetical protein [Actinomadura glauciflava]